LRKRSRLGQAKAVGQGRRHRQRGLAQAGGRRHKTRRVRRPHAHRLARAKERSIRLGRFGLAAHRACASEAT
jgi:hypothetical protein